MAHAKAPLGVCRQCWKPLEPPARTCEACRKKNRAYLKERREKRLAAGLCAHCGKAAPVAGKTECEACAQLHAKRTKSLFDERRKAGLCPNCGDKPDKGHVRCRLCRISRNAADRDRAAEWIKQGLCGECGKRKPRTGVTCDVCKAKAIKRHRRRRLRQQRAAEFRSKFKGNPMLVAVRFESLMRGKPRQTVGTAAD